MLLIKNLTDRQYSLHKRAVHLCKEHKRLEAEIIEVLREIHQEKIDKLLGYSNLYKYSLSALELSPGAAYAFMTVAKHSSKFPALKLAIAEGSITVAKAVRVVACLTKDNESQIIEFTKTHTYEETDLEMAKLRPRSRAKDQIKVLSDEWEKLECSISNENSKKLKRMQSLLSSKQGKPADFNDVLGFMLNETLKRYDPVLKAEHASLNMKRKDSSLAKNSHILAANMDSKTFASAATCASSDADADADADTSTGTDHDADADFSAGVGTNANANLIATTTIGASLNPCVHKDSRGLAKKSSFQPQNPNKSRTPLSAQHKNEVHKRDQGRCTFIHPTTGERCSNDRWIQIHHKVPVAQGGANEPSNLQTLCGAHHDLVHQLSLPLEYQITCLRSPSRAYGRTSSTLTRIFPISN
jgi:hypothetical protein